MDEFSDIINHLSENARISLQKADFYSKKYGNGYMSTEHLLLGILAQDSSMGATFLMREGINLDSVESSLNRKATEVKVAPMAMMSLSESTLLTLRMATNFAKENGLETIGTEHLLYSLIRQPSSKASNILTKLNVNLDEIVTSIEEFIESEAKQFEREKNKEKNGKKTLKWLPRYGTELTELAKTGKLDTVIGRDKEIERAVTILCRRTKSNPVLIGEPGVGKTAIAEGLASRIVNNDVPGYLIGKRIFQIDLSTVVAGTKFRGEFEERIKGIIDEATSDENIILFIDELHLLTGAGASEGSMDAANILKPSLARGKLHLIGATTLEEYRKHIEKDKALSRRLQSIIIEEPSKTITLKILKGIKSHYESHHGVKIGDDLLEQTVEMTDRYINDRFFPDKAIDIIDEASAIAKVEIDKKGGNLYKKHKISLSKIEREIEDAVEKEDYETAAKHKSEAAKITKEIEKLEKKGLSPDKIHNVTEAHLAKAISLKTGIPVEKVQGSEQKMLLELENHIKKSIIGQDEAVKKVAKAIRRGRSGIADKNRPIGSFLFMGPTGVGKTELTKIIAREVFGGENALIKIDMSEFAEKHNTARLTGAPAGYVGYDDGGKLTEAIRRRPYSVVLFDEIEKAHKDVFDLLLQILEDGTLTDGQGNKVKFTNSVIIMTSNIGAGGFYKESELGFGIAKTEKDCKAIHEDNIVEVNRALRKLMKPELLNRIDEKIVFNALTEKEVDLIFENLIKKLKDRLGAKSIGLKISKKAKDYLIEKGYDFKNGARPLRRTIEDEVESLLADNMLAEKLVAGDIANIDFDKNMLQLKVEKEK